MNKFCCFAGHRDDWRNIRIEKDLENAIEDLIKNGCHNFYASSHGDFDKKSIQALSNLKNKYPFIKIIHVYTYYHHDSEKFGNPFYCDETIYPPLENVHFKILSQRKMSGSWTTATT